MGDVDDLLPYVVRVLDFGAPLPEIVSFPVRYQAVRRYQLETVCRVVCTSAFQDIFAFSVHLEAFPLSVFVQYIFGTIVDRVFEHLGGCRVEGRIYPSPFADCRFHFGDSCQALVQSFDVIQVLFDACMGHTGRHQQERTFVEAGHKLLSDPFPDQDTEKDGHGRQQHELPPVIQAPAKNTFVIDHQQPEK